MIVVQPELAAAMTEVDAILFKAELPFVKDDDGKSTVRTYGVKVSEDKVRIALMGWNPTDKVMEYFGWWEEMAMRDAQEGIPEDESKSWVTLLSPAEFAAWLQGTWKRAT